MKKVIIGCLLVLFISGCSSKKAETTASSSSTSTETTETQISSTDESSTTQTTSATTAETSEESATTETTVVATTPAIIRGTWVGNNGTDDIEFTITDNTIISNGTEYLITEYTLEGNMYTIFWDLNSVSNPGNPQPFVYIYSPETDELMSGISFHRK